MADVRIRGPRGAPRKGEAARNHPFSIPMTRDLYVRLSDFAAAIGVTKTEAARRMIEEGVGDEMRKRRVET